jgi:hypothetical protein
LGTTISVLQGKNAAHRHNLTTNNEVVIEGERLTLNKTDTEVVRDVTPSPRSSRCSAFELAAKILAALHRSSSSAMN